jgi:hypothetical protein
MKQRTFALTNVYRKMKLRSQIVFTLVALVATTFFPHAGNLVLLFFYCLPAFWRPRLFGIFFFKDSQFLEVQNCYKIEFEKSHQM